MPLNRLIAALAAVWLLAAPAPSRALDFPAGVVRIVVPYLPGGSAEAQARSGRGAAEAMGQAGHHREQARRRHHHRRGFRRDAEARWPYALPRVHLSYRDAEPLQVAAL